MFWEVKVIFYRNFFFALTLLKKSFSNVWYFFSHVFSLDLTFKEKIMFERVEWKKVDGKFYSDSVFLFRNQDLGAISYHKHTFSSFKGSFNFLKTPRRWTTSLKMFLHNYTVQWQIVIDNSWRVIKTNNSQRR